MAVAAHMALIGNMSTNVTEDGAYIADRVTTAVDVHIHQIRSTGTDTDGDVYIAEHRTTEEDVRTAPIGHIPIRVR
jgi:hypothetical protein